jgi:hypothetical protein
LSGERCLSCERLVQSIDHSPKSSPLLKPTKLSAPAGGGSMNKT